MKNKIKAITIILGMVFILFLSGCSFGSNKETYDKCRYVLNDYTFHIEEVVKVEFNDNNTVFHIDNDVFEGTMTVSDSVEVVCIVGEEK